MFDYNTQRKKMQLPEYGRSVQNMVDYALTIENRQERQRCANTIVSIMGGMFPQLRDMPDFKHKLWDHLAIMSDFKLDIDYPFEVIRAEDVNPRPERLEVPVKQVRYRHYGHTLIELINLACSYEQGDQKDNLTALICNQMRRCHFNWNKDNVDEAIIREDLRNLSQGRLEMTEAIQKLMSERMDHYCHAKPQGGKGQMRQDGKTQDRNRKKGAGR